MSKTISAQQGYWIECVASAFEEHGVTATAEQIEAVAADIQGGHENHDMAFYSPPAGEHFRREIADLEKALQDEKDLVFCRRCKGKGYTIINVGTSHQSSSECDRCNGRGKHQP